MFGDVLSADQGAQLMRELAGTVSWRICAHGRPTNTALLDVYDWRTRLAAAVQSLMSPEGEAACPLLHAMHVHLLLCF